MVLNRKLVVLTPVKNEAWILERFLQVTSIFADHILIADQNSTDGSREICNKFSKVILIKNEAKEFNEADRQLLLLNKARELFGDNTILLAIDADEILAANAMETDGWNKMLKAETGTILYFEKPSFYKNIETVIRYTKGGWPLGFVDDGSIHYPSKIHSSRIPTPLNAKRLYLDDIKFLHFNSVRLKAFSSKQRYYGMLENVNQTRSLRKRLRMYDRNLNILEDGDKVEKSDKDWFKNWDNLGINFNYFEEKEPFWYDYEALKLLEKYGAKPFQYDDIWYFNWERLRQMAIEEGKENVPNFLIKRPNPFTSNLLEMLTKFLDKNWLLVSKITRKNN